ncbi:MAG TPA: Gfo/Idh/MocA family oxidoreductase [Candidatus Acidoferrum sp.]|nr:Gfo/Idh/MocA family oxidoreductase [Candidatus Acidoferrum sp.]
MPKTNVVAKMPRVAVVGAGYWGKNLVRNFHALGALQMVCDVNEETLSRVRREYSIATTRDYEAVLESDGIDALVIAAPAVEHYALTKQALEAGKHVFVEKPLALRCDEGRQLVELAKERKLILMVGHILEYHPAIAELNRLVQQGHLGKIQYIYSSRLNLGKLRTEENILWSFAPHDISVILNLLGEVPLRCTAQGGSYLNPPVVDTTLSTLEFESGVKAHIFVSWLHPFKEQKLCVIGSQKMAVFDDLEPEKKLILYAHRINWVERKPVAERDGGHVIPIPKEEPLHKECQHFLECVGENSRPRTNGENAVRVLEVLDACERSLSDRGSPALVVEEVPPYFAHATAVIDSPCEIGEGTKIWHFSHIMPGTRIGRGCNIGQNVVIGPNVSVGNNIKIQNNVSVYTGVELEDDVFCGPSMVFTNVINPRSHIIRKHEYKKTLVKRGATLGANCTIVCGATIGSHAFVAAGAVVTRDVADYSLVMGVPAHHVGWMCRCGIRLPETEQSGEQDVLCIACGRHYSTEDGVCSEIRPATLAASQS